ncbi:uncharacterized protein LOC118429122 [Branchiostoma floridae]|nr:uncharacterized protein LOC118429122 [Branchiostoma floridae]
MEGKVVLLFFTLVLLTSCACLEAAPNYESPNTRTERTRLAGFVDYGYPGQENAVTEEMMPLYQDEEDKRMAEAVMSNAKSKNVYKLGRLHALKAILDDITGGKAAGRKRAADLDVDNHAYKFSWTSNKKDSNYLQVGDLVELILNQKVQLP